MSSRHLKLFLKEHLHHLLGFSYALSGKFEQGEPFVTDSLLVYSIEKGSKEFEEKKNKNILMEVSKIIYLSFLSRKKNDEKIDEGEFFLLSDIERAACFLKYRMDLELVEISNVLEIRYSELVAILSKCKKLFDRR